MEVKLYCSEPAACFKKYIFASAVSDCITNRSYLLDLIHYLFSLTVNKGVVPAQMLLTLKKLMMVIFFSASFILSCFAVFEAFKQSSDI